MRDGLIALIAVRFALIKPFRASEGGNWRAVIENYRRSQKSKPKPLGSNQTTSFRTVCKIFATRFAWLPLVKEANFSHPEPLEQFRGLAVPASIICWHSGRRSLVADAPASTNVSTSW